MRQELSISGVSVTYTIGKFEAEYIMTVSLYFALTYEYLLVHANYANGPPADPCGPTCPHSQ